MLITICPKPRYLHHKLLDIVIHCSALGVLGPFPLFRVARRPNDEELVITPISNL